MTLRNATTITPTETRVRPTQPVEQGRLLLGRYEIRETFNRGQNGTVYKAWDNQESRFVGIREVKNDNSPQAKHARREYQIGQRLDHPGISKYHELQAADGNIYVVREWGEGQTLRELGAVGPEQRKEVMQQVLDIVEYVHSQGTVLRDLKSSNLSFSNGEVKLFEIGGSILAGEREERDQLSTLGVAGTTISTAPEVWMGATVLISDIWSCGSVLAELCLGHELEYDTERYKLKFEQIEDEKDRKIVEKAMKNEPSERYQTAKQMKEALGENQQTGALTVREQEHNVAEISRPNRNFLDYRLGEKRWFTSLLSGISIGMLTGLVSSTPKIGVICGVLAYGIVRAILERRYRKIIQNSEETQLLPEHEPDNPAEWLRWETERSIQRDEVRERPFNQATALLLLEFKNSQGQQEIEGITHLVRHLGSTQRDQNLVNALRFLHQFSGEQNELIEYVRNNHLRQDIEHKLISGIEMMPEVYNLQTATLLKNFSAPGLSSVAKSSAAIALIKHLDAVDQSPELLDTLELLDSIDAIQTTHILRNPEQALGIICMATDVNARTRDKLMSAITLLSQQDGDEETDLPIDRHSQARTNSEHVRRIDRIKEYLHAILTRETGLQSLEDEIDGLCVYIFDQMPLGRVDTDGLNDILTSISRTARQEFRRRREIIVRSNLDPEVKLDLIEAITKEHIESIISQRSERITR